MIQSITIRIALPSEKATLEALKRRSALANPGDRDVLMEHPEAFEILPDLFVGQCVFVAERENGIAGFATLMPLNEAEYELEDLFVDPGVWKAGIGRALVDHCAAVARDAGAQTLKVIGNPHAEGFYRACGFEQIGRIVLRFGHGLILSKPLGSARPET